jgi:hypothetical protein
MPTNKAMLRRGLEWMWKERRRGEEERKETLGNLWERSLWVINRLSGFKQSPNLENKISSDQWNMEWRKRLG